MKNRRSLIITGDDFGVSHEVNEAIIEAHDRGILSSASLMVTGDAFEEAVGLARSHPRLAVGLHLVVVSGRAVLPPSRIPHLVDRAGCFSSDPVRAGLKYQLSRPARRELRLEIRAQLEKFRQTGLPLSHVDGHQHMHMPPVVLRTLVDLSQEFGIRAIRLPSEELAVTLRVDPSGFMEKLRLAVIFGLLRVGYAERCLRAANIEFTDRVYGLLQSGRINERYLLGLVPQIRADRVEIYFHPTAAADASHPRGASRAQLEALLSDRVRGVLTAAGFRLATYAEVN